MNRKARPTTLRQKLALLAAGLSISVILCEVILRVQEPFFHIMAGLAERYPFVSHPLWNHYPPPNISVTIAAGDLEPYEFFTNSLGCRHPREVTVPKPSGLKRVLVMGDSFTEGYRFEDTIAPRLEKCLNETFDDQEYEVINCGATSYSPILYYLRLKHQFLGLQPDAIILNIDQTDIYDDYWRYRLKYQVDASGDPVSCGGEPPSGGWARQAKDWVIEQSYLARSVSRFRSRLFIEPQQRAQLESLSSDVPPPLPENISVYHASLSVDSAEWKTQVGFCLANILRVINLCKQQGVALHITMHPHKQEIRADEGGRLWNREFERQLERLCRERQVSFFSAYDGIAKAFNEGQSIYREHDIHYSNQGQRVWAELISDYFVNLRIDAVKNVAQRNSTNGRREAH